MSRKRPTMARRIGWLVMTVLAAAVAAYAAAALAGIRSPFVAELFARTPAATIGHLAGGMIAIAVGALQVSRTIRNRFLNLHRWLGRLYVLAVTTGGLSAIALAGRSGGGLPGHVGFALLGMCWLIATWAAYISIRRDDEDAHREWMFRSYGLTLAAVTLRIYLPLSQIAGMDFEAAYTTITWLCWVPNLIVVEWILIRRRGRRSPAI